MKHLVILLSLCMFVIGLGFVPPPDAAKAAMDDRTLSGDLYHFFDADPGQLLGVSPTPNLGPAFVWNGTVWVFQEMPPIAEPRTFTIEFQQWGGGAGLFFVKRILPTPVEVIDWGVWTGADSK